MQTTNSINEHSHNKKVIIIDCGSSKVSELVTLIGDSGHPTTTIKLVESNLFPFEQSHSVIISGGPHLFTDSPDKHQSLMAQFEFLKNLEIPTLGICLGHQALAIIHGGRVYRDIERREFEPVRTLHKHFLFENLPANPAFSEDHCEGIWPSKKMKVLADSEFYETEAIEILSRPMFGVQFHPETSGETGRVLINNFLSWADQQSY
ncbi:type 1 glutamine amidotransferase [Endozoicomonas sp. OPT23]|uniref:type 1 glutamine amidotransferase n=1 Tax=Endozoicomonas sp. OPT23 TaxID=2072845 RepID=UPI00189116EE|nr:gamma-glutamyl-gamma-aminobutyrate hydrolase family protein [Endozoicomonas sp. OPT23]